MIGGRNIICLRHRRAKRRASRLIGPGLLVLALLALAPRPLGMAGSNVDHEVSPAPSTTILRGGDAWKGINRRSQNAKPSGRSIEGRVTHVRDGDTIEVAQVPIRIADLDCAEIGSMEGNKATRRMRELVRSQTVSCRLSGKMSYDRHVGTCYLTDGRNIGHILHTERICHQW
ncbi:thermonuclease family protein [Aquicoccus sp.]|uniref:thermonuclease family protein n=1 Tax=Aquicoccus sp. TaxID=2055851 RepID=UPI003565BD42